MKEKTTIIRNQFKADLEKLQNTKDADLLQTRYLGKKGPVQELMLSLRDYKP